MIGGSSVYDSESDSSQKGAEGGKRRGRPTRKVVQEREKI